MWGRAQVGNVAVPSQTAPEVHMSPAPSSASHGGGRLLARPRWSAAGEGSWREDQRIGHFYGGRSRFFEAGDTEVGEKLPAGSAASYLSGAP